MTANKQVVEVLVYRVGQKEPELQVVPDTLEAQQKLVGGYLEGVPLGKNLMLMCNEEGQLRNLPPNRIVPGRDLIVGDFFVCRVDEEGGTESIAAGDREWLQKRYGL